MFPNIVAIVAPNAQKDFWNVCQTFKRSLSCSFAPNVYKDVLNAHKTWERHFESLQMPPNMFAKFEPNV